MATARVVHLPLVNPRRGDDRSPHLRVVRPGRSALRLSPRMGVVLTVIAFAALFAVAVCHALLIEGQAEVDQLDRDVAAQQARYEELRLEVAELKSPSRIRTEAIEELGMVPAGETVWLTSDEAAPADDDAAPVDSPDTSAARVKPYLEGAP
ncbi:MAG TPA: septum formation initiator family protein [Acidimicrobiales bacterium]|jgi:cell division protein FtsL